MPTPLDKPYVVSSSPAAVTLASSGEGGRVAFRISRETIEQAFQVTGSTEQQRQQLIESNMDEIWQVASARYESDRTSRRVTSVADDVAVELEAADLETVSMHIKSAANSTRSW